MSSCMHYIHWNPRPLPGGIRDGTELKPDPISADALWLTYGRSTVCHVPGAWLTLRAQSLLLEHNMNAALSHQGPD
jgi:hypothetical protein